MPYDFIQSAIAGVMPAARATGLFVSFCTFEEPTPGEAGISASGAPLGTFAPIAGLIDIPCMDAPQPPSEIKLGAQEFRAMTDIQASAVRHVLLNDYYPAVADGWREGWRAVVDGVNYDVCGVECDSQRTQTRLELKLVTAGAVQS